jgi:fructose-bisphosphate aldolase class I
MSAYQPPLTERQQDDLREITSRVFQDGKGVLAADDTNEQMGPKLEQVGLKNTAENRRVYRQLLFTTPNLNKHISAVILYDETFHQSTDNGIRFVETLRRKGISVGIQLDLGPVPLAGTLNETTTQGLDDLAKRAAVYKEGGCVFAKWRAVIRIDENTPSHLALQENANALARYASICQQVGLVPFVEPDVLCEGTHNMEKCQKVTELALAYTYKALADHHVFLEGTMLKPNMVIPGTSSKQQVNHEQIAAATIRALQRALPASVPGVAFLSGGQSELDATLNLNAINCFKGRKPWHLTFCYGRALQATVWKTWKGKTANVEAAQKALLHRAKANGDAQLGQYVNEQKVANEVEKLFEFKEIPYY